MRRGHFGGKNNTVVIAVSHDKSAHQTGRGPPGRCPGIGFVFIRRLEFDIGCPGKILPQEMRGPGLKRFSVLHHGFDAQRVDGAGKSFGRRFSPL